MSAARPRVRSVVKGTWATLEFVLKNFAAPIGFFFVFRAHGAKPAIALALGVTGLQLLLHWVLRAGLSPFFIVASGFTILFGVIDLLIATPRFFRLEPFVQNFIMGSVFLATLFTRMPIATWFATGLPERIRPRLDSPETRRYLRNVTVVWAAYFHVKGLLFLYLAFQVDLGELVLLRTIIGGGTLVLMFLGELTYRKWIRRQPL
jgi:uncharacterized membrane protein